MSDSGAIISTYSDLDNQLGQFNTELIVRDRDAINVALENLFSTSVGSRWWFPDFGASLRQFLFMPLTEHTATLIIMHLNNVVSTYEKRIQLILPRCTVVENQKK